MSLFDEPIAFFLAARRADGTAAFELGDLAGDRARGAGGARHNDRFAGFDLTDLRNPEIRRQAVEAE
jgi:hypothetical protein